MATEQCTLAGTQTDGHAVSVNGAQLRNVYPVFEKVGDRVFCGLPGKKKTEVTGLCHFGANVCPRLKGAKASKPQEVVDEEGYGSGITW